MSTHVVPPTEVAGSLAVQMNQRAMDEQWASSIFSSCKSNWCHCRPVVVDAKKKRPRFICRRLGFSTGNIKLTNIFIGAPISSRGVKKTPFSDAKDDCKGLLQVYLGVWLLIVRQGLQACNITIGSHWFCQFNLEKRSNWRHDPRFDNFVCPLYFFYGIC